MAGGEIGIRSSPIKMVIEFNTEKLHDDFVLLWKKLIKTPEQIEGPFYASIAIDRPFRRKYYVIYFIIRRIHPIFAVYITAIKNILDVFTSKQRLAKLFLG